MKTKALILNIGKGSFPDEKTGEVIAYSKTTIGVMAENSENFCGYVLEEITGKLDDYNILKKYQGRIVDLELIYKKIDKKNYRAKISKIDGLILSNNA